MIYGSVCSGIEAATVAWHPLGWRAAWFAEVDPYAAAVLAHHYPTVPNLGDFTKIGAEHGAIDLLVGGTPCQDFSIAGLRAGLAGDRGNLAIEFLRLTERIRPRWLVFENVPGLLSADGGQAFGIFLEELAKCGYGWAYRVLDAQYFGVPQRRRRVFVVGHSGGLWQRAAAVLFERESLSGNPAPSREKGERVAASTKDGLANSVRTKNRMNATDETLIAFDWQAGGGNDTSFRGKSRQYIVRKGEQSGALGATRRDAVCFAENQRGELRTSDVITNMTIGGGKPGQGYPAVLAFTERTRSDGRNLEVAEDVAYALTNPGSGGRTHSRQLMQGATVRRLTPLECERLQGFPDGYTAVPFGKRQMSDSRRYMMLGNSMAVPVMRWIGERINLVEQILAHYERTSQCQ